MYMFQAVFLFIIRSSKRSFELLMMDGKTVVGCTIGILLPSSSSNSKNSITFINYFSLSSSLTLLSYGWVLYILLCLQLDWLCVAVIKLSYGRDKQLCLSAEPRRAVRQCRPVQGYLWLNKQSVKISKSCEGFKPVFDSKRINSGGNLLCINP